MLKVEDIADIGGTKDDLDLLNVSDTEEVISYGSDSDSEDLKQELQTFVYSLNMPDSVDQVEDLEEEQEEAEEEDREAKPLVIKGTLFDAQQQWYNIEVPAVSLPKHKKLKQGKMDEISPQSTIVKVIYELASVYQQQESQAFIDQKSKLSPSDAAFLSQIVKKGTSSDRVSAMALSIQESPLHYLHFLDQLLKNVTQGDSNVVNGKRREVERVVDVLHELFRDCLCPSSHKLKFFGEHKQISKIADFVICNLNKFEAKKLDVAGLQKLLKAQLTDAQTVNLKKCLIALYAEDQIKAKYYTFIVALNSLSNVSSTAQTASGSGTIAQRSLNHMFNLLSSVPEQESTLLTMMVSKFGINNRVLSSKSVHLLTCLLEEHPGMKLIVVKEVEGLLNAGLGKSLAQMANNDKKSQQLEVEKLKDKQQRAQYNALVFLSQMVLNVSSADIKVARYLISIYMTKFEELVAIIDGPSPDEQKSQQRKHKSRISDKKQEAVKESMEAKMMSAILSGVRRAMPYALRLNDNEEGMSESTVTDHVDQLFKLVHSKKVNVMTSVQALQILSQMLYRSKTDNGEVDDSTAVLMPKLTDRFYRALYASVHDDRHDNTHKHYAIYLNVLYKSMLNDGNMSRVLAFVRRLVQVCVNGIFSKDVAFICAVLVVVGEVVKNKPEFALVLARGMNGIKSLNAALESDDEEVFVDRDELDMPVEDAAVPGKQKQGKTGYDALQRTPEYAGAEQAALFEILPLVDHYHPTVKLFASLLLKGEPINYPSDPLQDFTLIKFLDRFVFKNPKTEGSSKQRLGVNAGTSSVLHTRLAADRSNSAPVNIKKSTTHVPADEQFYKTYFDVTGIKERAGVESDAESLDDEQVQEAIQNEANKDEMPDSEVDDDMPDFDGADFSDVSEFSEEEEEAESEGVEESEDDDDDIFAVDSKPVQHKRKPATAADRAIKKLKTGAFASVEEYQNLIDKDPDWRKHN